MHDTVSDFEEKESTGGGCFVNRQATATVLAVPATTSKLLARYLLVVPVIK